jgi:hypothetical protein
MASAKHGETARRRAPLWVGLVVLALQCASTAHASDLGLSALDPGEAGAGFLLGVAALPAALFVYAVADVEYHELLIPPPLAWAQLGVSGAAFAGALAYQGPRGWVEPALEVGGFMLAVHALIGLIWYDDAAPARDDELFVRASEWRRSVELSWKRAW